MNQKDMIAVIKARGWRLRSVGYRTKWYVTDEQAQITISPRESKGLVLAWAMALITGDKEQARLLRDLEGLYL